jgi:hypothetical protein
LVKAKIAPNSIFAVLKTCANEIAPVIDKAFREPPPDGEKGEG